MSFANEIRGVARYVDNRLLLDKGRVTARARDDYEATLFDNFFGRTGLIFSVRSFKPKTMNGQPRNRGKVRLACVSSPIDVASANPELASRTFRDGCKLVELGDPERARVWLDRRYQELTAALALKPAPHIVCFGELAFPPPPPSPETGWDVDSIRGYALRRIEFEDRVQTELRNRQSKAFVFLGSFHCLMTLYNVGVVFPWGPSSDGIDVEITDEWLDSAPSLQPKEEAPEVVVPPITIRKRFPARRAGEVTRTPPKPTFDVFQTDFGRVGVLICSDVLDLNQFLTVARWNGPTEKYANIDFVLVPSLNTSSKLVSMCRELSYIARTTVVVVNGNPEPGNKYPDTTLFHCGLEISECQEIAGLKDMATLTRQAVKDTGAELFIFDIDLQRAAQLRESEGQKLTKRNRFRWMRSSPSIEEHPFQLEDEDDPLKPPVPPPAPKRAKAKATKKPKKK